MTTVSRKGVFLPQTGTREYTEPVTITNNKSTSESTYNLQPEPVEMESMQELIPFAKEMLSQKPSRGFLKVYLLGSVFAVLGMIIGLVETACHPFSSTEPMDTEMVLVQQRSLEAEMQRSVGGQEKEELAHENWATSQSTALYEIHRFSQRSMTNRLHAS